MGSLVQKINAEYSIKKEKFVKDKKGYLNPYKALFHISDILKERDKIVCGNASACIIPFQSIAIKKIKDSLVTLAQHRWDTIFQLPLGQLLRIKEIKIQGLFVLLVMAAYK